MNLITTGAPKTYMFDGKQYIVVAVGEESTLPSSARSVRRKISGQWAAGDLPPLNRSRSRVRISG